MGLDSTILTQVEGDSDKRNFRWEEIQITRR